MLLFFALFIGCGGRQDADTTPQTEPEPTPPPSTDYHGQLEQNLRASGIDVDALTCNTNVTWGYTLRDDAQSFYRDLEASISPHLRRLRESDREMLADQITSMTMNWFIRVLLIHGNYNNLGAVVLPSITWTDDTGANHPLIVFHSATTPFAEEEGSCLRSLLETGQVRHVINLYDGNAPLRDMIEMESRVAQELGASYTDSSQHEEYRSWREVASNEDASEEEVQAASEAVARLIRERILAPDGSPPRGNVYFHCAGGMHRSPLVANVLRRCIAGASPEQIDEAMQVHAAYENEERDGGYEPQIREFVRNFDCTLLQAGNDTPEASGEGAAVEDGAEVESGAEETDE